MVVMTGSGDEIVLLDEFASIKIQQYEKDFCVSAFPIDSGKLPRTLGRYYHMETAKQEITDLFESFCKGENAYTMRTSRFDQEEMMIHDSRVRRKGGS